MTENDRMRKKRKKPDPDLSLAYLSQESGKLSFLFVHAEKRIKEHKCASTFNISRILFLN